MAMEISRETSARVAWWATVLLIICTILLGLVPLFSPSDTPSGPLMAYIAKWAFIGMAAYVAIELHETAGRDSNDIWAFVKDSGLAIGELGIGCFIVAALWFKTGYAMTDDQFYLFLQFMIWNGIDLVYGIVLALRIAVSPRERQENPPHP